MPDIVQSTSDWKFKCLPLSSPDTCNTQLSTNRCSEARICERIGGSNPLYIDDPLWVDHISTATNNRASMPIIIDLVSPTKKQPATGPGTEIAPPTEASQSPSVQPPSESTVPPRPMKISKKAIAADIRKRKARARKELKEAVQNAADEIKAKRREDAQAAKAKQKADAKAAKAKQQADAKAVKAKQKADAKIAKAKEKADAKTAKAQQRAEAKAVKAQQKAAAKAAQQLQRDNAVVAAWAGMPETKSCKRRFARAQRHGDE